MCVGWEDWEMGMSEQQDLRVKKKQATEGRFEDDEVLSVEVGW